VSIDTAVLQAIAAVLLVLVAIHRFAHRAPAGRGSAALALWSFIMSTGHGAGLMLVPALIPLCAGDASARAITASGSLALALAAVGVHTAAMLAVTGLLGAGAGRGLRAAAAWLMGLLQPTATPKIG
jgi:hypothetical protein